MIGEGIAFLGGALVRKYFPDFVDKEIRPKLFPGTTYAGKLQSVIQEALDEYAEKNPIQRTDSRYPFYDSQQVVEAVLCFRFDKEIDLEAIKHTISQNQDVIPPSSENLKTFLEIFDACAHKDEKLKELFLQENWQEKIFEIDQKIEGLSQEIADKINRAGGVQNYLNQIENLIREYKPKAALTILEPMRRELEGSTSQMAMESLHKVTYMIARCHVDLMDGETSWKLFIEAHKLDDSNIKYKAIAANAYYGLGTVDRAIQLASEVLEREEYNPLAWYIKVVTTDNFEDLLSTAPEIVIKDTKFRVPFSRWLMIKKSVPISQLHQFRMSFDFANTDVPDVIEYEDKHLARFMAECSLQQLMDDYPIYNPFRFSEQLLADPRLNTVNSWMKLIHETFSKSELAEQYAHHSFYYHFTNFQLHRNPGTLNSLGDLYEEFKAKDNYIFQYLQCLTNGGQLQRAIQVIEAADYEDNEMLLLILGQIHLKLGNYEQGKRHMAKFVSVIETIDFLKVIILFGYIDELCETEEERAQVWEQLKEKRYEGEAEKMLIQTFILSYSQDNKSQILENLSSLQQLTSNNPDLRTQVSMMYFNIGEYDLALQFLESYVSLEHESLDLILYAQCLHELKKDAPKLLEIAKTWRERGYQPNRPLLIAEIELLAITQKWEDIEKIARASLTHFQDDEYLIYILIQALGMQEKVSELQELESEVLQFQFTSPEAVVRIGAIYFSFQLYKTALDLIYPFAEKKENTSSRSAYFGWFSLTPPEMFEKPTVVENGVDVLIAFDEKPIKKSITTNSIESDKVAQELIGKKEGDQFTHQSGFTHKLSTITVTKILNRYESLYYEINMEVKDDPTAGLDFESISIEDGSPEGMDKLLKETFGAQGTIQNERKGALISEYNRWYKSYTEITNALFGRNFIEAYFYLTSVNSDGFNIMPIFYYDKLVNINLPESTNYALDFSSVLLFYRLEKELGITFSQKFSVSTILLGNVKQLLIEKKIFPQPELSLQITHDTVNPVFYPENYKEEYLKSLNEIVDWIDRNCEVVIIEEKLEFAFQINKELQGDGFVQLMMDNCMLASRDEHVMITDDSMYLRFVPNLRNKLISTEYFLKKELEEEVFNTKIIPFLLEKRYLGLTVDQEILMQEFNKGYGLEKGSFERCLLNLQVKISLNENAVTEAIKFIKELHLKGTLASEHVSRISQSTLVHALRGIPLKRSLIELVRSSIEESFRLMGDKADIAIRDFEATLAILRST